MMPPNDTSTQSTSDTGGCGFTIAPISVSEAMRRLQHALGHLPTGTRPSGVAAEDAGHRDVADATAEFAQRWRTTLRNLSSYGGFLTDAVDDASHAYQAADDPAAPLSPTAPATPSIPAPAPPQRADRRGGTQ